MRRVLGVLLALALAACGGGGDDDTSGSTTTERATTTVERTTTTAGFDRADAAGLVTPPAGVSQGQADEFAADLTIALGESGWPSMERDESVALLQQGIDLAALQCQFISTSAELDPGVEATAATYKVVETRDGMAGGLVTSGVPEATARDLADGWMRGTLDAAGAQLCPDHADALAYAADQLA
jgi:hypothetical protein